tara:strand:+ start:772 stop:1152 length:381 start_codon:yes stop_codon:yes gene_type:complete
MISLLPAIVGTALKGMGQEKNQSDSGVAKQLSSKKYIDMADDMASQAQERQKYTSAVKPQADYSFINTVNNKYRESLATLSDVQEAAKKQALRQGLSPSIIKKIDYDFTFSDRTEGERTTIKRLEA